MSDEKTVVKLTTPGLQAHGEEITELEIRKPVTRDLKIFDDPKKGDIEKTIAALSKLSGVPVSTIESMNLEDFSRASEVVAGFFDGLGVFESSEE